jgi:uncharacterized protein YndB with AHSA1/START domain
MSTTETPARKAVVSYPADNELLITREFSAPKTLVLQALTTPEHVREWYGLQAGTMKVCEIDFRVGGKWHYVLDGGPGRDDDSFSGEYLEVTPDGFLSTESYDNMPGAVYQARITLTEADGITTLRNHLTYPTQEWRDGHVSSGMEYGMNISFNRLEELLARLS